MSGSASWCFIAKAFRRANDELGEGENGWGREWGRKRTWWPFGWPCWMEREVGATTLGELDHQHHHCHSFLFSAIQSPFHFPKVGATHPSFLATTLVGSVRFLPIDFRSHQVLSIVMAPSPTGFNISRHIAVQTCEQPVILSQHVTLFPI